MLSACHTLTRINGELAGDPLDLKMLAFTQYELHEPAENEQANFDVLFPTTVRPIQNGNNFTAKNDRVSGSVSSLIAGVSRFRRPLDRHVIPFSSEYSI